MIYSDSVGYMVQSGFTTRKVVFDNICVNRYSIKKAFHWTWNDEDCVYYRDDVDDMVVDEPIKNGQKTYVLKLNSHARYLVVFDQLLINS